MGTGALLLPSTFPWTAGAHRMAAVAEWWTQHLSSPQHGHIWLADVLGHQQMGGDGLPFPPDLYLISILNYSHSVNLAHIHFFP